MLDGQVSKNSALMYMWDRWTKHYRGALGHNQWSVYNVLTDWSTHAPSRSKNKITLLQRHSDKVQETLETNFMVAQAA